MHHATHPVVPLPLKRSHLRSRDCISESQASRDDPLFVELRAAQLRGASATRALCAARKVPCKLPATAVTLLDALLCVDPGRRPTIEQVRCHAWLAEPRPSPLMDLISGFFRCVPAANRNTRPKS